MKIISLAIVIKGTCVYSWSICQPVGSDYCIYILSCVYFMYVTSRGILILFTITPNHLCIIYPSLQDSQHFTNIR